MDTVYAKAFMKQESFTLIKLLVNSTSPCCPTHSERRGVSQQCGN